MMNRAVGSSSTMAVLLCCLGMGCISSLDPSLPVYTTEQVDSTHPGYRKTTVMTTGATYVNDFEEQSLQLSNVEPKQVVGRSEFGNGKICAIAGQDPSAYLAVDVGSEMPAYAVFRNAKHPPFDWRSATFQRMRLARSDGPAANKETTDAALIEEVVRTLRDGTPATPPLASLAMMSGSAPGVYSLLLFSDQLPGLIFGPSCYIQQSGQVYLTESLLFTFGQSPTVQAEWIPASATFSQWVQSASP